MPTQLSTQPAAPRESDGSDRPDPEQELRGLRLALSEGEGFRLILATYTAPSVRDSLLDRLRAHLQQHGVWLTCLDLSPRRSDCDLLDALQEHMAANPLPPDRGPRQAIAVVDLETCLDYQHKDPTGVCVLRRANLQREAFAERVPCPVVFWLMPVATGLFAREAPDLWHWRIATFDFSGMRTEPIEASDLTRTESFREFRGLPQGRQHEGIAALHDRLLQLEHAAGGQPPTPREEAQRASLLDELGRAHAAMGHREDALQATAEAVEIRRRLAAQRPDVCLPDLARSLDNLGAMQSDLGRREEALQATAEAVEIRRRLAAQRPDAFLPDLATSLSNLGNRLSDLGRREDALQATAEAVEILRRLAARRPDAFLPDLATSLNNLGIWLSDLGRREEALQAAVEAVEILRRLAAQRPDAFLPDLAQSLNNLGLMQSNLRAREEALQATAEAVRLTLPLAERYPAAFVDSLRSRLQNLRQRCADLDRDADADPLVRQAAVLLARLDAAGE